MAGRIDAGTATATLKGNTKGFTGSFIKAQLAVDGIRKALAFASKGFKAAVQFLNESAKAAAVQEAAMVSLSAALTRAGETDAPRAAAEFAKFASALQDTTTIGDEATIQAASIAASFGLVGEELQETTTAAADLATVMNQSLQAAMILLGKAFKGETGSLSRYGIVLDKNIPKSEKFAAVLKAITKQFGGAAQAQAQSFSGRLEQMGNRWGDLKEAVGAAVVGNELVGSVIQIVTQAILGVNNVIADSETMLRDWVNRGWFGVIKIIDIAIASIGFVLKAMQGFRIVGTLALLAIAKGFKGLIKIVELLNTPISLLLDGLVAIGAIDTNPLKAGFESVSAAADLAIESFSEVLAEQLDGFESIETGVANLRTKLAQFNKDVVDGAEKIKKAYEGVASPAIEGTGMVLTAEMQKARELAKKLAEEARQQAAEISISIGQELGQAFAAFATGAQTGEEALKSFAKSAIQTFTSILIQKLTSDRLSEASTISRATTEVTANAAVAASGAAASVAFAPLVGPALAAAALATISALVLGQLSKFHSGTISASSHNLLRLPGMGPGEGVATLQEGERVSSRQDVIGGIVGGGGQVRVTEIRMPLPLSRPQMRRFQRDVFFPEARRARLVPTMR